MAYTYKFEPAVICKLKEHHFHCQSVRFNMPIAKTI